MRTNENLPKIPRTGDFFFIILVTETHSLIGLPFRGRNARAKGTSPNAVPAIQESSSPLINLAPIQFPPTNLKGQETQCQGAWVSEHSKSAPRASGMTSGPLPDFL